jgi:hypothetical protein
MDSRLYDTPINQQDDNGDVVVPVGDVTFQPQKWAEADLRRDHDFSPSTLVVSSSVEVEPIILRPHRRNISPVHYIPDDTRTRAIRAVRRIREQRNSAKRDGSS